MNANQMSAAASALFASSANVVRIQASVIGAMKRVSHLKRHWHSLLAWATRRFEERATIVGSLVFHGPMGSLFIESLVKPVPVPCAVQPSRYRAADLDRSVASTGFRTVGRRGFRQRPVSLG
ncbi:hypothetical protein K2X85_05940 [bacterium]|jgi:hypothetical protein|nr:hypothetical protein [bacterium]